MLSAGTDRCWARYRLGKEWRSVDRGRGGVKGGANWSALEMNNPIAAFVAGMVFVALGCVSSHAEQPLLLDENFTANTSLMGVKSAVVAYPNTSRWAFTFLPGVKWPGSYGDGTNWLEGNSESQTYLSAQITSVKGKSVPSALRYDPFSLKADGLHIKASLLTADQQKAYLVGGHRRFGSGIVISRQSFLYGRFRVVAKLPSARGAWPAIWLLPAAFHWPPEIDILEAMPWGKHQKQIHVGLVSSNKQEPGLSRWIDVPSAPADGFHEYGLDWGPQQLTFLYDGRPVETRPTPSYLHEPLYILINLAVGGNWVYNELGVTPIDSRAPERLSRGADLIEKDYPAEMIIKSVRVSKY